MADRFDLIADTVSSTAASVAKRDGELTLMRRELETRIGNLENYVTAALQEVRSAEAAAAVKRERAVVPDPRARDDRKVVLLTEETAALSAQLQAMATTVEATSAGVAGHERVLEVLSRRLETPGESGHARLDAALEQRLDDLVRATTAAAQVLDVQGGEIATVRTALANSNDALEQRVEELRHAIAELVVRVEDPKDATAGDAKLGDALERRLDDVVQAVTSAVDRLDAHQAEIAAINTILATPGEALDLRVEELGQMVSELVGRVADLDRLKETTAGGATLDDALGQRLDDVVGTMTSAADQLDAQEAEISTLRTTLAVSNGALEQRVDQLGQTVAELVVRGDDLARLEEALAGGATLDGALGQRLDDVVGAMTSAAEQLDAQEAEISTLRTTSAASNGALEQRVDEIGQMVTELVVRGDDLARLAEAVARGTELDDELEQRLDDIVQALTRASERLDSQQLEIAMMTTTPSAPTDALEQRVEELRQLVAALAVDVHGLGQRDESLATSDLEERISAMSGAIDEMGAMIDGVVSRVDRIATSVGDSLAGLGDPEVGLAELDTHFTEASTRFETIIVELRSLIRTLPTSTAQGSEELVSQLDELRANAAVAAERIEHLESRPSVGLDNTAAVEHLEHELAALRARLQTSAMPADIVSQLDALRLSTSTVAAHIERIEDLASRTAENASSSASRIGADLAALARRIEHFERREDGLVAEIERAQALWPVALRSLEARLDDIVAKQDDLAPKTEEGGSLLAALHASLAAMQAVAAETPSATELPSSGNPQDNGVHTSGYGSQVSGSANQDAAARSQGRSRPEPVAALQQRA